MTEAEVEAIANHLGMRLYDFVRDFTDLRENRQGLTLIEKPDGACIFLEGNECAIQPVKPSQCKGFPNEWNFPGWEKQCEAIPIPKSEIEGNGDGEIASVQEIP